MRKPDWKGTATEGESKIRKQLKQGGGCVDRVWLAETMRVKFLHCLDDTSEKAYGCGI